MKGALFSTSLMALAMTAAAATPVRAAEPKYYFKIKEVTAAPDVDAAVKTAAADTLKAELAVWKKEIWDEGTSTWAAPNREWRGGA